MKALFITLFIMFVILALINSNWVAALGWFTAIIMSNPKAIKVFEER